MKKCKCSDPGCPEHPGKSKCIKKATHALLRIDLGGMVDMCEGCASDALESGVFAGDAGDAEGDWSIEGLQGAREAINAAPVELIRAALNDIADLLETEWSAETAQDVLNVILLLKETRK